MHRVIGGMRASIVALGLLCASAASAQDDEASDGLGAPADEPLVTCEADGSIKYILGPVEVEGESIADARSGLIASSTDATTNECGVFNGFVVVGLRLQPIVATFATGIVFTGLALWVLPVAGMPVPQSFWRTYGGRILDIPFVFYIVAALGLLIWLAVKTKYIIQVMAVGDNRLAAYQSGLPVTVPPSSRGEPSRTSRQKVMERWVCSSSISSSLITGAAPSMVFSAATRWLTDGAGPSTRMAVTLVPAPETRSTELRAATAVGR